MLLILRSRFAIPLKFGVDDNDTCPVGEVGVSPGLPSRRRWQSLKMQFLLESFLKSLLSVFSTYTRLSRAQLAI